MVSVFHIRSQTYSAITSYIMTGNMIVSQYAIREGRNERQIDRPKEMLVAMRKTLEYRMGKMKNLHKFIGIDFINYNFDEREFRDWFVGFHTFTYNEVIERCENSRPLSFFTLEGCDKYHIAISKGDGCISYLSLHADIESCNNLRIGGVDFIDVELMESDVERKEKYHITTTDENDMKFEYYGIMLPYQELYTVIFSDWEVLHSQRGKGMPVADKSVFQEVIETK